MRTQMQQNKEVIMVKKIKNKESIITKDTTLKKVLEIKGAEEILLKHNLPCMRCPMASMEMEFLKVGDIAVHYGLDLKKLLKELNLLIKK